MIAVVLVGGQGTRLRPLTFHTPKPMLPLVDRPLLAYLFDQLQRAGVTRAILSCGYLPDQIQRHFGDGSGTGLALEYAVEEEALGTAGAIRFAAAGRVEEPFLALNGDILSDIDLAALVALHRARGAAATISLTSVSDPSRYGLVRTAEDGAVREFVEKPAADEIDTDLINAGAYVLEPSVLELIPAGRAVSIEREIFPALVGRGLFAHPGAGYWSDVGTPASYLAAHRDVLNGALSSHLSERLRDSFVIVEEGAVVESGAQLVPPVYVGPGAHVAAGARVGLGSSIGARVTIGASVVEGAVLQEGSSVGDGASVHDSIVGPGARIGSGGRLGDLALIGARAEIGEGNVLRHGIRLSPGAVVAPGAIRFE